MKIADLFFSSEKTCIEYTCEVSFFVQYIFVVFISEIPKRLLSSVAEQGGLCSCLSDGTDLE